MQTMSWRLSEVDEALAAVVESTAGLRALTARILVSRGLS